MCPVGSPCSSSCCAPFSLSSWLSKPHFSLSTPSWGCSLPASSISRTVALPYLVFCYAGSEDASITFPNAKGNLPLARTPPPSGLPSRLPTTESLEACKRAVTMKTLPLSSSEAFWENVRPVLLSLQKAGLTTPQTPNASQSATG